MSQKTYKLKDYSSKREVLDKINLVDKCIIELRKGDKLFIPIPEKVRHRLRISMYNQSDFKVIICRRCGHKKERK